MLLLGIAGLLLIIAVAKTLTNAIVPKFGMALTTFVVAVGAALGTTVGTIVASTGATEATTLSIGIIAGALTVITGNFVVQKLITARKGSIRGL
jgi:hypothetical protein